MQADATTGKYFERPRRQRLSQRLPHERPKPTCPCRRNVRTGPTFAADIRAARAPALALAAALPARRGSGRANSCRRGGTAAPELPGISLRAPARTPDAAARAAMARSHKPWPTRRCGADGGPAFRGARRTGGLCSEADGGRAAVTIRFRRGLTARISARSPAAPIWRNSPARRSGSDVRACGAPARAENSALSAHPSPGYLARFENRRRRSRPTNSAARRSRP